MMAWIGCPACAKSIDAKATQCPYCGVALTPHATKPVSPLKWLMSSVVIVTLFVGGMFLLAWSTQPASQDRTASAPASVFRSSPVVGVDPDPQDLVDRSEAFIKKAEAAGLIVRWTCIGNEAYVREYGWLQFNIDQKRGVARSLAVACHAQKSGRRMTIKGYQTGRTLATFSGDEISVE